MKITNPFKYSWQFRSDKYFYLSLIFLVIVSVQNQIELILDINNPLIRYGLFGISTYFFLLAIPGRSGIKNYSGIIKFIVAGLLLSQIICISRGIPDLFSSQFNFIYLKQFLSGLFLLFLLPFILLISPNLLFLRRIFKITFFLAIVELIILVYNLPSILSGQIIQTEGYIRFFAAGSSMLLLTFAYHSKNVNWIIVVTLLLSFLIMALEARRNMVLYFSSVFFFATLITFFSRSYLAKRGRLRLVIGTLFISLFGFFAYFLLTLDFSYFIERVDTGFESRESVILEMTNDFNRTPNDWLFGRGMTGTFYSIMGMDDFGQEGRGERGLIENGYYQLILKSGLVYLILFILLSVIAAYKGFFSSKNILSKAAAAILIINLIDMIGYGIPELNFKYIFVWVSITICLSSSIRNLSDSFIKLIVRIR